MDIFIHGINKLFGIVERVRILSDDILVYSNTIEEQNNGLKAIFDRACQVQLKVNGSKSLIG